MYWADGFDQAPEVVQLAVRSWKLLNPDLELVLLDDGNVSQWVDDSPRVESWDQFDLQKKSDLLRMLLISQHGGFWADATLVCTRPLDQWLNFDSTSGVVFLRTPRGKNRFLQSFFLGAQPGSVFISTWLEEFERVLTCGAQPMTNGTMRRWHRRRPILWANPVMTSLWSVPAIIKRTGYPYLVPHYVANRLILTSPGMTRRYRATPKYWAGEALHLQGRKGGIEALKAQLAAGDYPLWKLTWRAEIEPDFWDQALRAVSAYLDAWESDNR